MDPLTNMQQRRRLNIVFVLGYPTRSRGGTEIAALAFSSMLAKRGHAITAIFHHDGELIPEYQTFCDQVFVLKDAKQIGRCIAAVGKRAWRSNLVVYGHHTGWIFALRLLASLMKARCVCHLHLPPPENMNVLARWGLRQTDLLIAVSSATRDAWARAYCISSSKLLAIPNGVDVLRFCPGSDDRAARAGYGLPPDCRVVSFLGRLDRQKGVDVLIRAFSLYRSQHPEQNAVLLIAGSAVLDGEIYMDELRVLAAKLGPAQVRFVGRVAEPVNFYHASDLFVLPSVWPEPHGLTLTESLACGVPVLASRMGGIPEILSADFPDHLFEPGDVDGLARKIAQLINWRMDSPQLGATCRNVAVSKFSLETCVDRIENNLLVLTQKVRR